MNRVAQTARDRVRAVLFRAQRCWFPPSALRRWIVAIEGQQRVGCGSSPRRLSDSKAVVVIARGSSSGDPMRRGSVTCMARWRRNRFKVGKGMKGRASEAAPGGHHRKVTRAEQTRESGAIAGVQRAWRRRAPRLEALTSRHRSPPRSQADFRQRSGGKVQYAVRRSPNRCGSP